MAEVNLMGVGYAVVDAADRIATLGRCGAPGGAKRFDLTLASGDFVVLVCRAEDLRTWSPAAFEAEKRKRSR